MSFKKAITFPSGPSGSRSLLQSNYSRLGPEFKAENARPANCGPMVLWPGSERHETARKNCGKCLFFSRGIFHKSLFPAHENGCKSLFYNGDRHVSPYVFFENLLKWAVCRDYRGRDSDFVKIGKAILGNFRPVLVGFRQKPRSFRQLSITFERFWRPKKMPRDKIAAAKIRSQELGVRS